MSSPIRRTTGVLILILIVPACSTPGPTGKTPPAASSELARRAADFAWRCEQVTGQDRLTCLDLLPWQVPGYFGPRTDPFRAPLPAQR
jgi:hypothetical protein